MGKLDHTGAALAPLKDLKATQPERFAVKLKRTIVGTVFAGMGCVLVLGQAKSEAPSTLLIGLGAGLLILGATVWSTEVVAVPLKLVLGALKDLIAAVKNGRS